MCSPDGRFVAYGSSDYTVGILDAQTLAVRSTHNPVTQTILIVAQPLLTILKAHEFPPTTLRFNPSSNLLVSGSADNTVRIVTVPDQLVGACEYCLHIPCLLSRIDVSAIAWSSWIIVLVTLLVVLFAIMAQQMHQAYLAAP